MSKPKKPRFACLNCNKKYCSKADTVCKNCELKLRIESLDLEAERAKIITHYEEHHASEYSHGKFVGELNKPRYKLFILNRNKGKSGGPTWFFRGDISLGYPRWGQELKKIDGDYKLVDVMWVSTYCWRYYDVNSEPGSLWKYYEFGETGRFMVGNCAITADACTWLEGSYEQMIKDAIAKKSLQHG